MKRDGISWKRKETMVVYPIPASVFYIIDLTDLYDPRVSQMLHLRKQRSRDGVCSPLFSSFFMIYHPYIPLHHREVIFPLVTLIVHSIWIGAQDLVKLPCLRSHAHSEIGSKCMCDWENHFLQIKRDVGIADHEKEKKQGVAYPIPTSLFTQIQHLTYCWVNEVS